MSPPKRRNSNPQPVDPLLIVVEKLLDHWAPAEGNNDIANMTSECSNYALFAEAREAVRQHEQGAMTIIRESDLPPAGKAGRQIHFGTEVMTKREHYAAAALSGLLTKPHTATEDAILVSFQIADAMIKQGEKT